MSKEGEEEKLFSWCMLLLWAKGPKPQFSGRPQQGSKGEEGGTTRRYVIIIQKQAQAHSAGVSTKG